MGVGRTPSSTTFWEDKAAAAVEVTSGLSTSGRSTSGLSTSGSVIGVARTTGLVCDLEREVLLP